LLNHVISSTGQPILIGTTTVEKSEMLAQLLGEYKSYQLLNANQRMYEENQKSRQAGSITIATNTWVVELILF
jgi:preprotein translocase subunit SecA